MNEFLFKGLAHVGILTDDAEGSVRWYCENLGFRPWYAGKMGPMPRTFVEGGGLVIEFIAAGKAPAGGAVDHFAMEVLNIEGAVESLKAKGIEVGPIGSTPGFFPNGLKNVFFTGPNGEKIEFVEYLV